MLISRNGNSQNKFPTEIEFPNSNHSSSVTGKVSWDFYKELEENTVSESKKNSPFNLKTKSRVAFFLKEGVYLIGIIN